MAFIASSPALGTTAWSSLPRRIVVTDAEARVETADEANLRSSAGLDVVLRGDDEPLSRLEPLLDILEDKRSFGHPRQCFIQTCSGLQSDVS
jgi:hypothetical protein